MLDRSNWIIWNLKKAPQDCFRPIKFSAIIWWLWPWRCDTCFGRPTNVSADGIKFLLRKFEEIIKAYSVEDKWYNPPCRTRREAFIGWEPPPTGWCALNRDGALKQNSGLAGGWGVLRGWNGKWLGGFTERIGLCSSVRAELRMVLQGLSLANGKGFKKLIVHVDSIIIVGMLKGKHDL